MPQTLCRNNRFYKRQREPPCPHTRAAMFEPPEAKPGVEEEEEPGPYLHGTATAMRHCPELPAHTTTYCSPRTLGNWPEQTRVPLWYVENSPPQAHCFPRVLQQLKRFHACTQPNTPQNSDCFNFHDTGKDEILFEFMTSHFPKTLFLG